MTNTALLLEAVRQLREMEKRQGQDFFCNNCGWRDKHKGEVKEVWFSDWQEIRCTKCGDDITSETLPF